LVSSGVLFRRLGHFLERKVYRRFGLGCLRLTANKIVLGMISATNISVARRAAQVAFAVFFCFTCGGIIFGFAGVYLLRSLLRF